jgi:hypothetical protein
MSRKPSPGYPTLLEIVRRRTAILAGGGLLAVSIQGCWGIAPAHSIADPGTDAAADVPGNESDTRDDPGNGIDAPAGGSPYETTR